LPSNTLWLPVMSSSFWNAVKMDWSTYKLRTPKTSLRFLPKYNVKIVLSGHVHQSHGIEWHGIQFTRHRLLVLI
jgi:UDP-2,3-diacylglucosamine pyrophosphatase LpxH